MGLCTSKKSIEQIIHSKYTLAKDSTQKLDTKQCQHVYIWKYAADDLAQKQVRFYDSENDKEQKQSSEEQFLQGQPIQWPIKCHSDQGYIILTIKNFTKELQVLTTQRNKTNKNSSKQKTLIEHFGKLHIPIQISQILYMIKLDSFRQYFYTRVSQDSKNLEFSAQIQIIVGDLVQKLDCLKLVTIAYELEKYLQRGGQNVFKMLYNDFQLIHYLIPSQNCQKEQNYNTENINGNRETIVSCQIPIERIFNNETTKIKKSENYLNEQQRQFQIHKLFISFFKGLTQFNVLNSTIFGNFNLRKFKLLGCQDQNSKNEDKKYNKVVLNGEISKRILQQYMAPLQLNNDKDNEKVNIFHTIKRKHLSTLNSNQQQKSSQIGKSSDIRHAQQVQLNEISIIQGPKSKKINLGKSKEQGGDIMDTSSPFICEITQIDRMREGIEIGPQMKDYKKQRQEDKERVNKIIQHQGKVDESLFLSNELQQHNTNKTIYPIVIPQAYQPQQQLHIQPSIMITSYSGTSQFHELQRLNVSLIINMSPWQCYNYFINDLKYDWFWVERLEEGQEEKGLKQIGQNDMWRVNISCIVESVVHRIESHLETIARQQQNTLIMSKQTHPTTKVLIFCSHKHLIYSGTITAAYLMLSNSYKLSFEHAYEIVRQSTNGKFIMPKVYEQQLRELERRINLLSSAQNLNALNTKSLSYQAYEIGLYTVKNLNFIVGRYVGQVVSPNQLQILPNNTLKSYILIPNNLTSIIVKSINILREDTSLLTSDNNFEKIGNISKLIKNMGLTLKLFYGKQQTNEQKKAYLNFVHEQFLDQLVKYEYINFSKKLFNTQKYKTKIQLIVQSLKLLITSQPIQKSFRKPQPFEQDPISLVNNINLLKSTPLTQRSHHNQPFNSKETLTFKYPILRPIFESKKKDNYYFMIKKFKEDDKKDKQMGCNVTFYKGEDWIGLEEDKERYFEKIVHEYLSDVCQERIWIEDEESCVDQSLFDRDSILF